MADTLGPERCWLPPVPLGTPSLASYRIKTVGLDQLEQGLVWAKWPKPAPHWAREGPQWGLLWPRVFRLHVLRDGNSCGPIGHRPQEALVPFLVILGRSGRLFLAQKATDRGLGGAKALNRVPSMALHRSTDRPGVRPLRAVVVETPNCGPVVPLGVPVSPEPESSSAQVLDCGCLLLEVRAPPRPGQTNCPRSAVTVLMFTAPMPLVPHTILVPRVSLVS